MEAPPEKCRQADCNLESRGIHVAERSTTRRETPKTARSRIHTNTQKDCRPLWASDAGRYGSRQLFRVFGCTPCHEDTTRSRHIRSHATKRLPSIRAYQKGRANSLR